MELREILWVVLVSATPIGELRAGIPTAYFGYDFPWYYAFLFSVLGNLGWAGNMTCSGSQFNGVLIA